MKYNHRAYFKFRSLTIIFTIVATIVFQGVSLGNNRIITPWRAMKRIVKAGDSFPVLFENLTASDISKITLSGPFNDVVLSIDSINIGQFEYDSFTKNSVNNKIWVKVPSNAPEELYDLVINCGEEISVSRKSVKVIKKFSKNLRFIHISDTHISRQWVGNPETGHAKELELFDRFVDVANVISPDFIMVTGDIIHHYTRFNADSTGWGGNKIYDAEERPTVEEKFRSYFEGCGEFSGVHGLNTPVFSLPGNHDSYGVSRKNNMAMAKQWNKMCGQRTYAFAYGNARILVADDYLSEPIADIPEYSPLSDLQRKYFENYFEKIGKGDVQIMAQHRPERIDTAFLNKHDIDLLLNGHNHTPNHEFIGKTPTSSIRSGAVCRSGSIKNWEESLGLFRIVTVENGKVNFSPPLRFCEDPTKPYRELGLNLTLDFTNPNDGTSTENKALINNLFNTDLPECKVRFLMKHGDYQVEGGTVSQVIRSEGPVVVDVLVDIKPNSKKTIKIYQKM